MRKLGLLLALTLVTSRAPAQEQGEMATLRRALALDPFAVTPYRILSSRLDSRARARLVDELSQSALFADQVVAARIQIDGGQAQLARARLHQGVAQLPNDVHVLDAFAQLALSAGAYAEAAQAAEAALRLGRTPPRLIEAAVAELRQGRHKEGLALLAEVRSKDATGVAAESAVDAMLAQRMVPEAVELLRAQLEAKSGAGTVTQWRQLADLERQLGHADLATDALLHALDVEPSATGRRSLSQAILRANHDKKALAALCARLRDASTTARLVLRGDVETELGKTQLAVATYTAAAKADPADPEPALRLAATARTPEERIDRYAELVALHPNDLRFALQLADLRFSAKDEAGGKKTLREAAEHMSLAPSAQAEVARRLSEHGDAVDALACRKRAAQLDPGNVEYVFALADAYRAAGDRAHAVATWGEALSRSDGSRSYWDRVLDALESAGYDAESDARYTEARKKWPNDLVLSRRHAAELERTGQLERAIALWQKLATDAKKPFDREQAEYSVRRLQLKQTGMR